VDEIRVNRHGRVDLDHLAGLLSSETRWVSIQLANHETGVLQPIAAAAEICAERGVRLHTDAVQAVGKVPVDFARLGAAAMSVAAHKFHGPRGIGLLAFAATAAPEPQIFGGFQQSAIRPGTESLSLVVGMRVALERWHREQQSRRQAMTSLRDEFERELLSGFDGAVIQGGAAERLPQTSNVAFPGLDRQALLIALDLAGVACSAGSACASGSSEPSPVLRAMGCDEPVLKGALRFSLGATTGREEVVEAARRILKICNNLRAENGARKFPRASRS
jgi:cysteine desulfurase